MTKTIILMRSAEPDLYRYPPSELTPKGLAAIEQLKAAIGNFKPDCCMVTKDNQTLLTSEALFGNVSDYACWTVDRMQALGQSPENYLRWLDKNVATIGAILSEPLVVELANKMLLHGNYPADLDMDRIYGRGSVLPHGTAFRIEHDGPWLIFPDKEKTRITGVFVPGTPPLIYGLLATPSAAPGAVKSIAELPHQTISSGTTYTV